MTMAGPFLPVWHYRTQHYPDPEWLPLSQAYGAGLLQPKHAEE